MRPASYFNADNLEKEKWCKISCLPEKFNIWGGGFTLLLEKRRRMRTCRLIMFAVFFFDKLIAARIYNDSPVSPVLKQRRGPESEIKVCTFPLAVVVICSRTGVSLYPPKTFSEKDD